MTNILMTILSWTSDILVNYQISWDNLQFTLWNVMEFHLILFVLLSGIFGLFGAFMRRNGD